MSPYAFDQGREKERNRLAGLEALYDGFTTHLLADLGVTEGWRCLEVGFGAGSVALWLAGKVGSTGRVVATDLDPRFLDGHGRANLEVRKHNIVTDPLEEAAFDLAHARCVLEWIVPDWQRALEHMISAVRPGGWLVLEDIDYSETMVAGLAHYTDPPEHAALYERVLRAFDAAAHANQIDTNFGSKLPRALMDAGCVNVDAEVHTRLVAGGANGWFPGMVEFLADTLIDTGMVTASDIESFLALLADPSFRSAASVIVTAWGQRPE